VKSCVGSTFCRFGLDDSIAMAQELEKAWEGLHTPHKVKCGSSGCPRNCAEATIKDIGVVAVEGGWQIWVGGAAGANVRAADLLATVETRQQAIRLMSAFLQYYRENATYLERTYDFVPRVGLETVREVCMDPERSAVLRERLEISRAGVRDPWLERDTHHATQFAEIVGAEGEPVDLRELIASDPGEPA
jgi:nitrite reductase (NADH) large subunit